MSEQVEVEKKESEKIRDQFTQVCMKVGESVHRIELVKKDLDMLKGNQTALQLAYDKALADEKAKEELKTGEEVKA